MNKKIFLSFLCLLLSTQFSVAEKNLTSVNMYWCTDWMEPIFADAMMTCRGFQGVPDGSAAVPVDADGWPTEDTGTVIWHGHKHRSGTYRLSFNGKADLAIRWATAEIRNKKYDAEANKTTAEIYFANPQNEFRLNFSNTGGGVRNIKLMRPIEAGSSVSHDVTEMFDRQLVAVLKRFDVVRYMDATETNASPEKEWSNRKLPTQRQSGIMAWEYVIQLSNETGTDPWINVPHQTTDNYVTELAKLFRDQPLDPERKLYVEYSNEVWNWGGGFDQSHWNVAEAARCVIEDVNHPLNFDHAYTAENAEEQKWGIGARRTAYRGMQISDIFRSVFGDNQMMSRVRPVFCWQVSDNGMHTAGHSSLMYLDAYMRTQGRSVPDAFWGGGPAGYYSPGNSVTELDDIWDSNDFITEAWANRSCQYDAAICATYGLHYVLYEGGPGFGDALGGSSTIPVGEMAWNDPRIYDAMIDHHKAYNKMGGELFCYYVLNHDYRWKFISSVDTANTYKMQAIDAIRAEERDLCELGRAVPISVRGGDFDIHNVAWKLNNTGQHNRLNAYNIPANEFVGYNLRNTSGKNMVMVIEYKSNAAGVMQILAGGRFVADVPITASGSVQRTAKITLNDMPLHGLYGIRLYNKGTANLTIENLVVTQEEYYQLTLVSDPEEAAASLTGTGQYATGQSAQLNAVVNDGFAFVGWYDGETLLSNQAGYTYTIEGDKTLTAKFTAEHSFAVLPLVWTEYGRMCDGRLSYLSFVLVEQDTIVNNKTYKKLYYLHHANGCSADEILEFGGECIGGLRQSGDKIYFTGWEVESPIPLALHSDFGNSYIPMCEPESYLNGNEILLYDFSLKKGDVYTPSYSPDDYSSEITVGDVDEVEIGGKMRKRIQLGHDKWIEGIGSYQGILKPFQPILRCENHTYYLSSMFEGDNAFAVYGDGRELEKCNISIEDNVKIEESGVELFKSGKILTVRFLSDNWVELDIVDMKGSMLLVKDVRLQPEVTLPLYSYPAGVYLLVVKSSGGNSVFKFVVE